jgi:hypothetical protein
MKNIGAKAIMGGGLLVLFGAGILFLGTGEIEDMEPSEPIDSTVSVTTTSGGQEVSDSRESIPELTEVQAPAIFSACAIKGLDMNETLATVHLDSYQIKSNTYHFSVTNFYKIPILVINIGRDNKFHYHAFGSRIPEEVLSPPGWTGVGEAAYESPYLGISWVGNLDNQIPEGVTVSGFGLRMLMEFAENEIKYKDHITADNMPVIEMDLASSPFAVQFIDGSCYWGNIQSRL